MDQARLFLAIALSFVIFLLWQAFFVERPPVQQPPPATEEPKPATRTPVDRSIPSSDRAGTAGPYQPKAEAPVFAPAEEARIITVDTPLFQVKISERGAVFISFVLKKYREEADDNSPLKELIGKGVAFGTIQVGFSGKSVQGLPDAVFSTDRLADTVRVSQSPQSVSFRWVSPQGIEVEKRYSFYPDTYLIGLTVDVKNGSDRPIQDNLTLSLRNQISEKTSRYGFEGPSVLLGKKVEQIKAGDIEEKNVYTGDIKWVAIQDRYFMTSIVPKEVAEAGMHLFLEPNHVVKAQYMGPAGLIQPGTQQGFEYELFLGPRSVRVLQEIGRGLEKAVNFGWFDFIAKPCLWLMNFLYSFIPNYGIAIIILTILMKGLLWPLGTKSYKSMNEMKKLQPIMTELREKYKGDKKRMNEEIMQLYRTYKINPMGGCLPMIAQIPVFFALYRMLYEAIELRHAPFFGWINDLSAPDRLFHFGFSVPLMQPPYGIPVLTLVMGGTMFLQQKMTPAPGDPNQAKMMMLMPVVFTFIFINFSSGLVLYWLVNNVLSISQQYYITKKR